MRDLLTALDTFEACYAREQAKIPYHLNVIEEMYVNENSHTKFLIKLLGYRENGRHPVFESFLKLLKLTLNVCTPQLCCGYEYIDGRIEDREGNYAVIIENKIYGACDQPQQLERYIETLETSGYACEQIYVVYLTLDGGKTVSEESLTGKARQKLGILSGESAGRYIPVNYRQHLHPWLRQEVLPLLEGELPVLSAVIQYTDYIEGLLEMRPAQQNTADGLSRLMEETFRLRKDTPLDNLRILSAKEQLLQELQKSMIETENKYIAQIRESSLVPPLEEFCNRNGLKLHTVTGAKGYIEIELRHPEWTKCRLIFHTEGGGNLLGLCYYDDEDTLPPETRQFLQESFPTYKAAPWWPLWKYAPRYLRWVNTPFWEAAYRGDMTAYLLKEFTLLLEAINQNRLKLQ